MKLFPAPHLPLSWHLCSFPLLVLHFFCQHLCQLPPLIAQGLLRVSLDCHITLRLSYSISWKSPSPHFPATYPSHQLQKERRWRPHSLPEALPWLHPCLTWLHSSRGDRCSPSLLCVYFLSWASKAHPPHPCLPSPLAGCLSISKPTNHWTT